VTPRITVLAGGLGGARLALALTEAGWAGSATFVTTVADDWWVGELPVCPDTDAVLYALAGLFDEERGWGVRGDEFPGPGPGEPSWFGVGAADRRHHLARKRYLDAGAPLSGAVAALCRDLAVASTVLPVTDDPVRTRVRTGGRWVAFQEWLVRDHAPPVERVDWAGLDRARPAPGVLAAVRDADLVVLGSSSPVASLLPILGVPGVGRALRARRARTVALSPVAVDRSVRTERDRHRAAARAALLAAQGRAHTPEAVAELLSPFAGGFVLDPADAGRAGRVAGYGVVPVLAPVVGIDPGERAALVEVLGELAARAAA
jgi:LPPG:FO 2-phospho-L-lactate transferase